MMANSRQGCQRRLGSRRATTDKYNFEDPGYRQCLFIRDGDGAMRFYDTREQTWLYKHDHHDWTAPTLQAQLAMAENVDVSREVMQPIAVEQPRSSTPL